MPNRFPKDKFLCRLPRKNRWVCLQPMGGLSPYLQHALRRCNHWWRSGGVSRGVVVCASGAARAAPREGAFSARQSVWRLPKPGLLANSGGAGGGGGGTLVAACGVERGGVCQCARARVAGSAVGFETWGNRVAAAPAGCGPPRPCARLRSEGAGGDRANGRRGRLATHYDTRKVFRRDADRRGWAKLNCRPVAWATANGSEGSCWSANAR